MRVARCFVRAGLQRGEKVLYAAARKDVGGFAARLARDGGFACAMRSGQLDVRDARELYTPGGSFDGERLLDRLTAEHRRALAQGYSGLSATSEMDWALDSADGARDLVAYERGLGRRTGAGTVALLCQYDHARFPASTLREVAAAHDADISPELQAFGRDDRLAAARIGGGVDAVLRLSGHLDLECADTLAGVLGAHFHGRLRLDLAGVDFADVTGMRALRGRTAQPLEIVAASETVHRLLRLLAWDTDPNIDAPALPFDTGGAMSDRGRPRSLGMRSAATLVADD